ncbi:hypothetical protein [Pseudonocardia sp. N23]|nr:hypothetical protein [Pseudonocardia sp. N23]
MTVQRNGLDLGLQAMAASTAAVRRGPADPIGAVADAGGRQAPAL